MNRPALLEIVLVSRDRRDRTRELRKLWALVLHGLVRATGYDESDFRPGHVGDIVHALERCGGWGRKGAVEEFRAWHAEQRRERETYKETARKLHQLRSLYDGERQTQSRRSRLSRLEIALAEVEALAAGVVYFGDDFTGRTNETRGETIAARFVGHYLLEALRGADAWRGRQPRSGLGGEESPAIGVLHEWLARILKPHGAKPPDHDNLARVLRRGQRRRAKA